MNEKQFELLMVKLEEIKCCIIDVETSVDILTADGRKTSKCSGCIYSHKGSHDVNNEHCIHCEHGACDYFSPILNNV